MHGIVYAALGNLQRGTVLPCLGIRNILGSLSLATASGTSNRYVIVPTLYSALTSVVAVQLFHIVGEVLQPRILATVAAVNLTLYDSVIMNERHMAEIRIG